MAKAKTGSKNDAGQSTPKYRTAAQDEADRKRAAANKKKGSGGRETHNSPNLNAGRDANFLAWARKNPQKAIVQADVEARKGNDWQMQLIKRHRIGQLVVRPVETKPVPQKPLEKRSVEKPKQRVSAAKLAELQTAVGAAQTDLQIAKAFHPKQVPAKLAVLATAKRALEKAEATLA